MGDERATALMSIDKSIESRFKTVFRLRNMGYRTPEEREYFKEYLKSVQALIQTPSIAFDTDDFALRMYASSAGNVREIKHLVTECIGSIRKKSQSIDKNTFAFVFSEMGANPLNLKVNPFSIKLETLSEVIGVKV